MSDPCPASQIQIHRQEPPDSGVDLDYLENSPPDDLDRIHDIHELVSAYFVDALNPEDTKKAEELIASDEDAKAFYAWLTSDLIPADEQSVMLQELYRTLPALKPAARPRPILDRSKLAEAARAILPRDAALPAAQLQNYRPGAIPPPLPSASPVSAPSHGMAASLGDLSLPPAPRPPRP